MEFQNNFQLPTISFDEVDSLVPNVDELLSALSEDPFHLSLPISQFAPSSPSDYSDSLSVATSDECLSHNGEDDDGVVVVTPSSSSLAKPRRRRSRKSDALPKRAYMYLTGFTEEERKERLRRMNREAARRYREKARQKEAESRLEASLKSEDEALSVELETLTKQKLHLCQLAREVLLLKQ